MSGRPWSEYMDELLLAMKGRRCSWLDIAEQTGRSVSACVARYTRLRGGRAESRVVPKGVPAERPVKIRRRCLGCDCMFGSDHAGNRLCECCTEAVDEFAPDIAGTSAGVAEDRRGWDE